jgi:TetR/AcrR family transcriptional repressor of nem operon
LTKRTITLTLKDEIIHESQKLFSLNGFLNTGINDIIQAADTSKGGFYNYFSSKEELFLQVLAEAQRLWRERVLAGVSETEGSFEKIKLILENYRDRYLEDSENFPGGCIFITFSVELDDQRPHLMKEVYKGFRGFTKLMAEIFNQGIEAGEFKKDLDAEKLADFLFTSMLGASVLYGVDKSEITLDKAINPLIDHVNGFRRKK